MRFCQKICKTKRGLKRHITVKHKEVREDTGQKITTNNEASGSTLTAETLVGMVYDVKILYGNVDLKEQISYSSCTKSIVNDQGIVNDQRLRMKMSFTSKNFIILDLPLEILIGHSIFSELIEPILSLFSVLTVPCCR